MDHVYLKSHSPTDPSLVPIETAVSLFLIRYIDSRIPVTLVPEPPKTERSFRVDTSPFAPQILLPRDLPDPAKLCDLPNIVDRDSSATVAGLCATLRRIVKLKSQEEPSKLNLLGFKSSCLLACSEVSVWTKFCEIDVISTLKHHSATSRRLPESLARFERHMAQPVRLHNLYKYTNSKKFADRGDISRDEAGNPDHSFAEGATLSLSDLIVFVCVYALVREVLPERVLALLPFTWKWYIRLLENEGVLGVAEELFLGDGRGRCDVEGEFEVPEVENQSLYKSDQKRYRPRNRIYTRQEEVEHSLDMVQKSDVDTLVNANPFGYDEIIDRNKIPYDATPEGGALPIMRLERKFQQLENLCKPVMKLARPGDVIVDFCSGSGHLGILMAHLLPECKVILLENKEESMNRARARVRKMALKNIWFCQCNLDYLKGDFDIGTSLHACGVATDLVIRHCVRRNAVFVCCPCCYGSIQNCYHISYPRSAIFRDFMDKRSYLVLGHAADQTHDEENAKTKQGYACMAVIDTDRKLQATQSGYKVHLAKLSPSTCTPKNNLLVGVPVSRHDDMTV